MDISDLAAQGDIIVTGYHVSGVDLLHRTISHLTNSTTPLTNGSCAPNILCYNGHLPSQYPDMNLNPSKKTVFIVRNPKDVAVVMYKNSPDQSSTEFSDFLHKFVFGESGTEGKWCEHTKQWEALLSNHPSSNLQLLYFDDFVLKFETEVTRLCQFLSIRKDANQISEMCSFLRKEAEQPQRKRRKTDHNINGNNETFYDIGIWKNHFTVNQQQQFDQAIVTVLNDSKLDLIKLLCN